MNVKPAQNSAKETSRNHSTIGVWLRGVFMGMADVVPGFSGGTVALITGIYQRLISAISQIDAAFLRMVRNRKFRDAASHIDFRFLLTLGIGIGCGFLITLLTVHKLLDSASTRPYVLAAFLGLVLGSSFLVFQMIYKLDLKFGFKHLMLSILGAAIAATICLLPQTFTSQPPIWYVFLCGMVAICAMILPGISGALILVILGCYKYLSDIAHDLVHRENLGNGLLVSAVFGVGAIIGLLAFSRVLKFLFNTRPGATLSFLFGLMIGSVVKLWPFQVPLDSSVDITEAKLTRPIWPETFGNNEILLLGTTAAFAIVVFAMAMIANKYKRND